MKVIGELFEHGRTVIGGLKDATGHGAPETGELFRLAQSAFDGVNDTLGSAAPAGWDGPGSHAYAAQNARQQLRIEAMAAADREVHNVLSREAAQIALRRGHLDDQCKFLADTRQVAFEAEAGPRYGEAMRLAVEMAAVQSALAESCHQVSQLCAEVAQNAAELQQAVGRYASVADAAELPRLGTGSPAVLSSRDGR